MLSILMHPVQFHCVRRKALFLLPRCLFMSLNSCQWVHGIRVPFNRQTEPLIWIALDRANGR